MKAIDMTTPNTFKVILLKITYVTFAEKVMDKSVEYKKGTTPKYVETGGTVYFMKCDLMEVRAGFSAKKYMQGTFEITQEEYETRFYEKGDKLEVWGAIFDIDNFVLRDVRPESLKMVEKKYHKVHIDSNGNSVPYVENRIANLKLKVKKDNYRLVEKKHPKYYYIVDGLKFEITQGELEERVFTFFCTPEICAELRKYHLKKDTRVELWDTAKRQRVDTAEIQCGEYEGDSFINLIITSDTPELRAEKQRLAQERREAAQLKKQQAEERRERKRIEREEAEARREQARLDRERLERERIEHERLEKERLAREAEEAEKERRRKAIEDEGKAHRIIRIGTGEK